MQEFIPIARVELSEAEIEAAVRVLRTGRLRQGACTEEFERAYAEEFGARHAIAVSSGTAALHICYLATLKPGDEVLVPSFGHISTASMAHFAGCKPVFCDVDPRTFTLDLEDAERRVTGRTRCVAPIHLFGNACDIAGIISFAEKHGLLIVWDAAQAHGTRYRGRDVGSFDNLVCYSFYPTKNMTTGEGGMVTTNDGELAEKCRLLRSHWQTKKYFHPGLGFNYRMSEVEAAIGHEQLKVLGRLIDKRRTNASYLTAGLEGVDGVMTPLVKDGVEPSYHQYTILLEPGKLSCTRDEFADMLRGKGIGTGVHYPRPMHKQPAFESMYGETHLPVVEDLCTRILSLPVHPHLSEKDLARIVEAVREVASGGAVKA